LSNVDELPDLAGEVSARTVTPPYDAVTGRVRARRRRATAGTLAATAFVVGGLALWQDLSPAPAPAPAPPVTSPGPVDGSWRQVVDGTDSHPFVISGTDDGSVAVVWRALEPGAPTFALVVRGPDGTVHGRWLDEPLSLTPVPGGWVGTYSSRAWLITTDGHWSALPEPTGRRDARAGDVLVRGQYSSWLYSPVDRSLAAVPDLDGGAADGYVTPDGVLDTCRWNGRSQIFFSPSDILREGVPGKTCVMAGRGDDLAIVGLGDRPDGGIPMTGLMTRSGDVWHYPRADLLPGVSSVVVTPGGSTVVTDASSGRWLLVRPDGQVTTPQRKVGEAFVAGDRLYVSAYGFMKGPLFYSEDDGRTWTETVLPGIGE
jgi:hypothetical protein